MAREAGWRAQDITTRECLVDTKAPDKRHGEALGAVTREVQEQERPPGEEEGAFPYSDSAKREYRSVSYVVGAGARPGLGARDQAALAGVVSRPLGHLDLALAPGGLGPAHDLPKGQAGAAGGPGGIVVFDLHPSGADLHPYGQALDLDLAGAPGRRPAAQFLAPDPEGAGLAHQHAADLVGQGRIGQGA